MCIGRVPIRITKNLHCKVKDKNATNKARRGLKFVNLWHGREHRPYRPDKPYRPYWAYLAYTACLSQSSTRSSLLLTRVMKRAGTARATGKMYHQGLGDFIAPIIRK